MSGGLSALAPTEEDIAKLLMSQSHIGSKNVNHQMKKYVFKRKADGTNILNLHKTWEKIVLAARLVAGIENPKDVCAISGPAFGQRAVLKFAAHVGATPLAGRFTPGTFTNQIQKAFQEPRLLIVTDPIVDRQSIVEASYVNLPVIALTSSDSPLQYVDVAIPCNNKSKHSVGLIWWMLSREVLRLRGSLKRDETWEIMPDLYFYRDPEEIQSEDQAATKEFEPVAAAQWDGATAPAAAAPAAAADEWSAPAGTFGAEEWANAPGASWAAESS